MDFFIKNLKETAQAVNELFMANGEITVKRIRTIQNISAKDHSKINFIWRALNYLRKQGFLGVIRSKPVKIYKLTILKPIDIKNLLIHAREK